MYHLKGDKKKMMIKVAEQRIAAHRKGRGSNRDIFVNKENKYIYHSTPGGDLFLLMGGNLEQCKLYQDVFVNEPLTVQEQQWLKNHDYILVTGDVI